MDILAHGLWSNILVYPTTKKFIKKTFGIKDAISDNEILQRQSGFGEGASKKYASHLKERLIAVLFGVLPDLIPFTPLFIYMILNRLQFWDVVGSKHWTVLYAPEAYNFTHSLVIFLFVFLLTTIVKKRVYWPMLAWGLHILMDLFTHPDFYRTPFLFPVSDYRISFGLSWGHPVIMIPQYLFFAIWYLRWILRGRKKVTIDA